MPGEALQTVRRWCEMASSGRRDEARALIHPEIAWTDRAPTPDQVTSGHGLDSVRHHMDPWFETFDSFRIEIEEAEERGGDVVCLVRWTGEDPDSRARIDNREWALLTVRGRQITRVTMGFRSREDAFSAAGPEGFTAPDPPG